MRRYFVCDLIWNWYDRPTPIYVLETSEELTIEEFKKIAKDIFPAPTKWGWVNVSFYTEEELEEEVKNLIRRDLTLFTAWDSEEDLSAFVEWKYEEWLEEEHGIVKRIYPLLWNGSTKNGWKKLSKMPRL